MSDVVIKVNTKKLEKQIELAVEKIEKAFNDAVPDLKYEIGKSAIQPLKDLVSKTIKWEYYEKYKPKYYKRSYYLRNFVKEDKDESIVRDGHKVFVRIDIGVEQINRDYTKYGYDSNWANYWNQLRNKGTWIKPASSREENLKSWIADNLLNLKHPWKRGENGEFIFQKSTGTLEEKFVPGLKKIANEVLDTKKVILLWKELALKNLHIR